MEQIINNWALIIAAVALVVSVVTAVVKFTNMPTAAQIAKVKEWLLYAVTMAEKELGGGTGKLKLRYVYDLFLTKFSWLAKVITFEQFSALVDEALEEMKRLLESNNAVKEIVNNNVKEE